MMEQLAQRLESSSLHQIFSSADWFVPAVQTVHILGIAVVVTTIAMLNVRLLRGPSVTPSLSEMSARFMPWTWSALLVLLLTGILLVITEPSRELISTPFQVKMVLVLLLAVLSRAVQLTLRRDFNFWHSSPFRRHTASIISVTNLVLCVAIVAAGRLIAYIVHG